MYAPAGQADKKEKKPKQEQTINLEKQKAKEAKKAAKKAKAAEHKAKENKQSGNDNNNNQKQKQVVDDGSDCAEGKYGKLPLIQSKEYFDRELFEVITLNSKMAGKDIWVRARVHNVRIQSAKLGFINLRQQQCASFKNNYCFYSIIIFTNSS